jgi:predicted HicB family RNase H-like nuclease
MTKTAALSIRIEPKLKADLERLAAADKRSLASYVEIALQRHVDDQAKPTKGRRE